MSADATGLKRVCDQCGAPLTWDAAARALRCTGCGVLQSVVEDGAIGEHDLEAALADRKVRGRIGSGTRQVRCGECHAEVELPDELAATRCEFCGSQLLVKTVASEDHYLPEAMVPFAIDRAAAVKAFHAWLAGLWLRPNNLRQAASLHELAGIYIPYWAFDCDVTSRWSADAGYTYYVEERTDKGRRRVPRVRWEPAAGERHDRHEDHLTCASAGLAADFGGAAQRFQASGFLPYAPEYLLGFSAERYAVDLLEAWQRARRSIGSTQERRCAQDIPGDTQRSLRATHQFRQVRFKHVLLPMWIAAYRYRGKLHRFIVNGQTGQVAGTAPRSAVKIALVAASIILAIAGLAFYLHARKPRPQISACDTLVMKAPSSFLQKDHHAFLSGSISSRAAIRLDCSRHAKGTG